MRQKEGVTTKNTLSNSKRPTYIKAEQTHLAPSLIALQENIGPKSPYPVPTLLRQEMQQPAASRKSKPQNTNPKNPIKKVIVKMAANARRFILTEVPTTWPLIRSGRMALGCSIFLSSFLHTL